MPDRPPQEVTVRSPAKINLVLGVGSPRPDAYHPLATVYQAVGLHDDVTASRAGMVLLFLSVAWTSGSVIAGQALNRFGYRAVAAVGMLLMALGFLIGRGSKQVTFDKLLERYLAEVQAARQSLPRVDWVPRGLPSAGQLLSVEAPYDASRFFEATLRFAQALRNVPLPRATRFSSEIGLVVIGTPEKDSHGPGAALIIDPGGNDSYLRAPATGGAVSVIVDLEGDDRYAGSDVAAGALSALVDFSGHDRYAMSGPGLAAAIGGAALLVDFAGDDRYEARELGQGAAAFGTAALIDLEGDDEYVLVAWGQGFGMADGVGLLWDRAGNDRYSATGRADPYARGGSVSFAQGAAFGLRTTLGGGIGILRDDSGNDAYEAEMFAQGTGYYYGLGMLWDRSGDDEYRAVRYGQGNGVHEAVGVLAEDHERGLRLLDILDDRLGQVAHTARRLEPVRPSGDQEDPDRDQRGQHADDGDLVEARWAPHVAPADEFVDRWEFECEHVEFRSLSASG